jgi:hypothetical protein
VAVEVVGPDHVMEVVEVQELPAAGAGTAADGSEPEPEAEVAEGSSVDALCRRVLRGAAALRLAQLLQLGWQVVLVWSVD